MSVFKTQVGGGSGVVLLSKDNYSVQSSTNRRGSNTASVSSIYITNSSSSDATVSLLIVNTSDTNIRYYIVDSIVIPGKVSLLLDHPFSFNVNTHSLAMTNTGTSALLNLIID
jgi:hypothetical protein